MNFKTTFVLFILVVIGVGIWLYTARTQPAIETEDDEQVAQTEPRYVLDPRPERNTAVCVRLERPDQPTLVFERTEKPGEPDQMEPWRMTEPLDSATENYTVEGLANLLTGLQYQRSFKPGSAGGVSLADAGLEPPAATLTIRDKEGKDYAIEIGKKAALSNDTYVRVVGSDEVKVVGRDLSRDIQRKTSDYRAKRVFDFTTADVRHLLIEHEDTTYDLNRGAGDQWVINAPIKAYARAEKVKTLLNALSGVRVKDFIDDHPDSLATYGLEPPTLTITVTTEKEEPVAEESPEAEEVEEPGETDDTEEPTTQPSEPQLKLVTKTYTLAVGQFADLSNQARCIKLADQPWVASATTQQLDRLIPKLAELRDPLVTRIKASRATRIEITTDEGATTLEKQGRKWQGTGDLANLDTEAVKAVLSAFEDLSAIDYIDQPRDLAEYGLDQPRAVLAVTTAGTVEPVTLRIGADTPSGRNTYVQVAGQSSVMVISADRVAELAVKPISLRSREITSSKPEHIRQISVQHPNKRYKLQRKDDQDWQMLEPPDAPPDPAAVRELVNDLSRLRAKQVVAKDNYAAYGLAAPALTVQFVIEQPIETEGPPEISESQPATQPTQPEVERVRHTLLVGRRDEKSYVRIDDDPYVFELDETVYKVLTQELIRRGLFDIQGEQVTYLKIEAPGGVVEFQLADQQWTYPPDKFLKLSQKKVGDFVNELAELRVNAYMAYYDGGLAEYGLDDAPVKVTMRLEDESVITLKLDQVRPGELPRKAAWVEQQRVFLLQPTEAEKLMRGLDYYVKQEPASDSQQD